MKLKSILFSFLFLMTIDLLPAAAAVEIDTIKLQDIPVKFGIGFVSKEAYEAIKLGDMDVVKAFVEIYGANGTIFNDKSCCSILQLVLDTKGIPPADSEKVLKAKLDAAKYLMQNGAQAG